MKEDIKDIISKIEPNSYTRLTLEYILEHGSITTIEAFEQHRNTRLSASIYELRTRYMVPIATDYEVTQSGKRYGIYSLQED